MDKSPNNAKLRWILSVALLFTSISVFVPFYPAMPDEGLDPSWTLGMNQAFAQGLIFGKDMIFTFGPYASIYTRVYHPATDTMMLAGGLYLSIIYWIAIISITKNSKLYLIFLYLVVIAGLISFPDARFLSYPLIVGLCCFKLVRLSDEVDSRRINILLFILFMPLGLLPLIKGSFLILSGAITLLSAFLFLIYSKPKWAIIALVVPFSSTIVFWMVSGQQIIDLTQFFVSTFSIASGYTEAMASSGNKIEIVLFLISAGYLLISVISNKNKLPLKQRLFIFSVFFVFLFLAFKHGFVRHDAHAIGAGLSILIAALLLSLSFNFNGISIILITSMLTWIYIDNHYIKTTPEILFRNIYSTYSSAANGLIRRFANNDWPKVDFHNALLALKTKANFPIFSGTTDIYSYQQSFLIASGNHWNPRPILQSYSAYTSSLIEKNRDHLIGNRSPDNIIFRVEPVDGRIPSLEDGASWPVLLRHFQPMRLGGDFLFLKKRVQRLETIDLLPLNNSTHSFGDVIPIPSGPTSVFVEILINQTFFGKLANFFFKTSPLQILLSMENGETKTYNIVAGMAKSGFVVSPLVENTYEFGLQYTGKFSLKDKRVNSFSITPTMGNFLWSNTFDVVFKEVNFDFSMDTSMLDKIDQYATDSANQYVSMAESCDGAIDFINGVSPAPTQFAASGLLSVHGWLAKSIEQSLLAESALLVLSNSEGRQTFIRTHQTRRPDLGVHFKNPIFSTSGYTSTADVSALDGHYTLGLAFRDGGAIKICPQFKIPAEFRKFSTPLTTGQNQAR